MTYLCVFSVYVCVMHWLETYPNSIQAGREFYEMRPLTWIFQKSVSHHKDFVAMLLW